MQRQRRRAFRRDLSYQVWIAYGETEQRVPCTLSNVSDSGARLIIPFNGDVPNEFDLLLTQAERSRRRRCRVAWRTPVALGVEFLI